MQTPRHVHANIQQQNNFNKCRPERVSAKVYIFKKTSDKMPLIISQKKHLLFTLVVTSPTTQELSNRSKWILFHCGVSMQILRLVEVAPHHHKLIFEIDPLFRTRLFSVALEWKNNIPTKTITYKKKTLSKRFCF